MDNLIRIQQINCSTPVLADYISKPIFRLQEDNGHYSATVKCIDLDGEVVGGKEVFFTQEEYDAWGTDNEYIYNLILNKLGMTRI